MPVGYIDRLGTAGASRLFFVHADQLARPQKITDAARVVVWDGQFAPFGEVHNISGTIVNSLMFPGQIYDRETGLSQNWHRDYDAKLGRYLQSDPIGLDGGINTYAYVGGNPTMRLDVDGRVPIAVPVYACLSNPLCSAAALATAAYIGKVLSDQISHSVPPDDPADDAKDDALPQSCPAPDPCGEDTGTQYLIPATNSLPW